MPFIRGTRFTDTADNVTPGVWVELSTDPPGTWTGAKFSQFPAIVTTGPVANRDTVLTYAAKCETAVNNLARKQYGGAFAQVVMVKFKFSSLSPLTLDPDGGFEVDRSLFTSYCLRGATVEW